MQNFQQELDVIEEEMQWFQQILQIRIEQYFQQSPQIEGDPWDSISQQRPWGAFQCNATAHLRFMAECPDSRKRATPRSTSSFSRQIVNHPNGVGRPCARFLYPRIPHCRVEQASICRSEDKEVD